MIIRILKGCFVGAAMGAVVATIIVYTGVLIDYIIEQINTNQLSGNVVFFVFIVAICAALGFFFVLFEPNKS